MALREIIEGKVSADIFLSLKLTNIYKEIYGKQLLLAFHRHGSYTHFNASKVHPFDCLTNLYDLPPKKILTAFLHFFLLQKLGKLHISHGGFVRNTQTHSFV